MKTKEWHRLLARHPELRRLVNELVRENPQLDPHREVLGVTTREPVTDGQFRPFTRTELEEARRAGW